MRLAEGQAVEAESLLESLVRAKEVSVVFVRARF